MFVPNYYSDELYAAAVILTECDLNWRGKLRNALVYIQFYLVTTLFELGWISALREHRFPWKTDSSWENYLLTYNWLASLAKRFQSTSSDLFLWSILILSFSLHVLFLSCSLKKSCVLLLLLLLLVVVVVVIVVVIVIVVVVVGKCTDVMFFFRLTQSWYTYRINP